MIKAENKAEKVETKAQGGPQSKSQPGYLVIPEGAEVESFLLFEILPTRLLFKIEGEEDRLVELFKYDEKAIKGGGNVSRKAAKVKNYMGHGLHMNFKNS